MTQHTHPLEGAAPGPGERLDIFGHVVVGVDETEESLEAVRQARRLLAPEGSIVLLAADEIDFDDIANTGWHALGVEAVERDLRTLLERAGKLVPDAEQRVVQGAPVTALLETAAAEDATLIVLGTHGLSRAAAVVVGSVGYRVMHEAPCSVLLAKPPLFKSGFPAAIVAGVDGTPGSLAAVSVARELAGRFGSDLQPVCAADGKTDVEAVRRSVPGLIVDDRDPVEALAAHAADADLLVVGNRSLHGLRSLGSVSERLVHKAPSSILVVRDTAAAA